MMIISRYFISIPFFFLLFFIANLNSQEIVNYKGVFNLKSDNQTIEGKVTITFNTLEDVDSIQLYLNNTAVINRITMNDTDLEYDRKSPKEFLVDVDVFLISIGQLNQKENEVCIWYSYSLKEIRHPNFVYRPDWIELSLYTGWYPFNLESKSFSYQIDFDLPKGYTLVSKEKVEQVNTTWKMNNSRKNMDIVCLLSNNIKTSISKGKTISIHYKGYDSKQINQLENTTNRIYELFETKFGRRELGTNITILANPFNHPMSYARRNIISISTNNNLTLKDELILAHEIAHLWWNNASYGSYEEWLNESFAELSKLIWIGHKYGEKEVESKIVDYSDKSIDTQPILNVGPNHRDWYRIAYLKGSIILWEFKNKLGDDDFFRLCSNIADQKIATTELLLKYAKKEVKEENVNWLLKQITKNGTENIKYK